MTSNTNQNKTTALFLDTLVVKVKARIFASSAELKTIIGELLETTALGTVLLFIGIKQPTIGELVAKDFRKAEIFKKYNLDFCCGGKKTVTEACNDKKVDYMEVEKELNTLDVINTTPSQNFDEWNLDFLVDYILNTHHEYVKKSIPLLIEYTSKVAKVHGGNHPEVINISQK